MIQCESEVYKKKICTEKLWLLEKELIKPGYGILHPAIDISCYVIFGKSLSFLNLRLFKSERSKLEIRISKSLLGVKR
jgi:hypothetical protein